MDKNSLQNEILNVLNKRWDEAPLIASVTNFVTAEFVANCQLAAGGRAAVVNMPDEAVSIAEICSAFYINLGTILPVYEKTIPAVAQTLAKSGKKWVLDPVAAGLGELRTKLLLELKEYKPSVIRGNPSEIIALAKIWELEQGDLPKACGVDSVAHVDEAKTAAVSLAKFTGGAVVVSGSADLITDGTIIVRSYGGSALMERVTGCGCALSGIVAFCLAFADPFTASVCAVNAFNHAGTEAEKKCSGTGSFKTAFLDQLYSLTADKIAYNHFETETV